MVERYAWYTQYTVYISTYGAPCLVPDATLLFTIIITRVCVTVCRVHVSTHVSATNTELESPRYNIIQYNIIDMPAQALIKTHHMTSRTKLTHIAHLTRTLDVSVLLRIGPVSPGVILVEAGDDNDNDTLRCWIAAVKKLRYLGWSCHGRRQVEIPQLGRVVSRGDVRMTTSLSDFAGVLAEVDAIPTSTSAATTGDGLQTALLPWWKDKMGFGHGHHG